VSAEREEFRAIMKGFAKGPSSLRDLDPEVAQRAMALILGGAASPPQVSGFFLIGRAKGNSPAELAAFSRTMERAARRLEAPGPPVVSVTGGFDGKVRTINFGSASSLLAAAAGGRVLLLGSEGTPPKEGRTVFDALRGLGVEAPQSLAGAAASLQDHGLAATTLDHYLPELYALLPLRREMVVRTALNVSEKLFSPVAGSRFLVGVNHRSHVEAVPAALAELKVSRALVVQAIEGSDEAPLDGSSALVRVEGEEVEEFRLEPASLGLSRVTRSEVPWKGPEDEARRLLSALEGKEARLGELLVYNAALRLWVADGGAPLEDHLGRAREALFSGAALALLERLTGGRSGARSASLWRSGCAGSSGA
jgi:anthranilate phosphoribosyltransferase